MLSLQIIDGPLLNILARIIETIQAATQEIIKSYGPYIRGPR